MEASLEAENAVLRQHVAELEVQLAAERATILVLQQSSEQVLHEMSDAHIQLQVLSRRLLDAHENERKAIARELHDEIGQTLTGLRILLEVAPLLPENESRLKIKLAQVALDELINRVSSLSLDLRPPMLDDMGLLPALVWFTQRYTAQTGIQVEFTHAGLQNRRIDVRLEIAAYRLVQEALTNIARHAGVNEASVYVAALDKTLELTIEDAGCGFDLQAVRTSGASGGLAGMRERTRLLAGSFEIDSAPGLGTRIAIHLPLDEAGQVERTHDDHSHLSG